MGWVDLLKDLQAHIGHGPLMVTDDALPPQVWRRCKLRLPNQGSLKEGINFASVTAVSQDEQFFRGAPNRHETQTATRVELLSSGNNLLHSRVMDLDVAQAFEMSVLTAHVLKLSEHASVIGREKALVNCQHAPDEAIRLTTVRSFATNSVLLLYCTRAQFV